MGGGLISNFYSLSTITSGSKIDLLSASTLYEVGLYRKTKKLLSKLNYQSDNIFYGDGYKGLDEKQPFDKILVTAGAEEIPKKLLIQLKVGGIMVIPVGKNVQEMIVVKRISKLKFEKENHGSFKFVPLLKDLN